MTFATTSIIFGIVALLKAEEGENYFRKAIDAYNEDASTTQGKTRLEIGLTSAGFGLIYNF